MSPIAPGVKFAYDFEIKQLEALIEKLTDRVDDLEERVRELEVNQVTDNIGYQIEASPDYIYGDD